MEPSKIGKAEAEKLAALAKAGKTDEELAASMGWSRATLHARLADAPALLVSEIREAKAVADDRVQRSLFDRACGWSCDEERTLPDGRIVTVKRRYPPDTTACIFWLKNRRPKEWRDRQEIEHSGEVDFRAVLQAARARLQAAGGE